MKPMQVIERSLAIVGAVAILAVLTGQMEAGSGGQPNANNNAYPTFLKMGATYKTDTNDSLTPVELGGGNWVKANAVVSGNRTQEPVWVNLTRYTWISEQR